MLQLVERSKRRVEPHQMRIRAALRRPPRADARRVDFFEDFVSADDGLLLFVDRNSFSHPVLLAFTLAGAVIPARTNALHTVVRCKFSSSAIWVMSKLLSIRFAAVAISAHFFFCFASLQSGPQ